MGNEHRSLDAYVRDIRGRFEEMLGQAVEIPSISMDPAYATDIRLMAQLAAQYLRDAGAEAHIVETSGYPIVSGGWTAHPAYPTVTIYNHMDVQPAQEPEWRQAPFAFRRENDLYHGPRSHRRQGAGVDHPLCRAICHGAGSAAQYSFPLGTGGRKREPEFCCRP